VSTYQRLTVLQMHLLWLTVEFCRDAERVEIEYGPRPVSVKLTAGHVCTHAPPERMVP
jgi:hypothetical protein